MKLVEIPILRSLRRTVLVRVHRAEHAKLALQVRPCVNHRVLVLSFETKPAFEELPDTVGPHRHRFVSFGHGTSVPRYSSLFKW
jgi:hypothetical protein